MKTAKFSSTGAAIGLHVVWCESAAAQTSPAPNATATRPADTPPAQTSAPNTCPPASINKPTGSTDQDETVKRMNDEEKRKKWTAKANS